MSQSTVTAIIGILVVFVGLDGLVKIIRTKDGKSMADKMPTTGMPIMMIVGGLLMFIYGITVK